MPSLKIITVIILVQKFILFIFQFITLKEKKKSSEMTRREKNYWFAHFSMTRLSVFSVKMITFD